MVMSRIGYLLIGLGFLAAWLVPLVGVVVMVVGAVLTAIASERVIVPELLDSPASTPHLPG